MGTVMELLSNATFRVRLVAIDHVLIAHAAGKMRKSRIRVLAGGRVKVEMTRLQRSVPEKRASRRETLYSISSEAVENCNVDLRCKTGCLCKI